MHIHIYTYMYIYMHMNKILDSLIGTQEMLNSQASGSTEFQTSPGPSVQFW